MLQGLTVDGTPTGTPALPILIAAMRYVFDPQVAPAALAYRSGATTTVEADGHTPVARATPYYLLADAFASKRGVLAQLATTDDGAVQASRWKAATSTLVDQVLTVDHVGAAWQFHNRRFHAITQIGLDFLRGRIQAPHDGRRSRRVGPQRADVGCHGSAQRAGVRRARRSRHARRAQPCSA